MFVAYLRENVPDITDDISLRLLVKKNQDLQELTFRLNCDDGLLNRLSDPSYWPAHVMISEFVEKNNPKLSALGDFFCKH